MLRLLAMGFVHVLIHMTAREFVKGKIFLVAHIALG
jgi:hypothetical protein